MLDCDGFGSARPRVEKDQYCRFLCLSVMSDPNLSIRFAPPFIHNSVCKGMETNSPPAHYNVRFDAKERGASKTQSDDGLHPPTMIQPVRLSIPLSVSSTLTQAEALRLQGTFTYEALASPLMIPPTVDLDSFNSGSTKPGAELSKVSILF